MNYKRFLFLTTIIFSYSSLHAAHTQNIARMLMKRELGQSQAKKFFSEYIFLPEALKCCSQFILLANDSLPAEIEQSIIEAKLHCERKNLEDEGDLWATKYQFDPEEIKPLIPLHVRPCINSLYLEQKRRTMQEALNRRIPARILTKQETELLAKLPLLVQFALFANLNLKPYVSPWRRICKTNAAVVLGAIGAVLSPAWIYITSRFGNQ